VKGAFPRPSYFEEEIRLDLLRFRHQIGLLGLLRYFGRFGCPISPKGGARQSKHTAAEQRQRTVQGWPGVGDQGNRFKCPCHRSRKSSWRHSRRSLENHAREPLISTRNGFAISANCVHSHEIRHNWRPLRCRSRSGVCSLGNPGPRALHANKPVSQQEHKKARGRSALADNSKGNGDARRTQRSS
jgi:hypothetical protein